MCVWGVGGGGGPGGSALGWRWAHMSSRILFSFFVSFSFFLNKKQTNKKSKTNKQENKQTKLNKAKQKKRKQSKAKQNKQTNKQTTTLVCGPLTGALPALLTPRLELAATCFTDALLALAVVGLPWQEDAQASGVGCVCCMI